jgi:hypothetical protein
MATIKDHEFIGRAIEEALKTRIAEVIDEEVADVQSRVERRVRDLVGAVATSVASRYSVERMGDDVLIRVKIEGIS